jgi:hypothetical protein
MSNHEFATNNYLEVLVDDEVVDFVGPNMISCMVQNYPKKGCKWKWKHQKLIKLKTKPWKHDQWLS